MRIGQNPAKSIQTNAQAQKITAAVANYIPSLSGYFAQSLEVLRLSLKSMRANAGEPFDLMVFDNASCAEVREYLIQAHARGEIQTLILSEQNMGKGGAWNFLFGAAQGEYVAYGDNDIYYAPGWLTALMHAMQTVPDLGMITGMPLLNPEEFSTGTVAWAERHPQAQLERGRMLSWEDYWRHAGTLGNDEEKGRAFYEQHDSLRLTLHGEQYYVGAGHFQFLARREVLRQALPLPAERPMGQVRSLDVTINRLGYLRLCTPRWWVRHLGNTLEGEEDLTGGHPRPAAPARHKIRGPLRRILSSIHDATFDLLNRA